MTRTSMIDLTPATVRLAEVVRGVRDDQLHAATPCQDTTVGDLLDHVDGLSVAFTAAATKEPLTNQRPPVPAGSHLGGDWRASIPRRLAELAEAWRTEAAWSGMTGAGGVEMPGDVAGTVAVDEVVVHGWDIAVATGQPFDCDPALVQAALAFVTSAVEQNPEGSPGLFGPPVPVPDDAPLLDRLVGLTGRDPAWRPPGR
ncbi:MAG TPA: TIGR03086 family metal-binding protein [Nocardioidaceae bacterium]|jgi:uncharacterized protein (TIGR03086 family)